VDKRTGDPQLRVGGHHQLLRKNCVPGKNRTSALINRLHLIIPLTKTYNVILSTLHIVCFSSCNQFVYRYHMFVYNVVISSFLSFLFFSETKVKKLHTHAKITQYQLSTANTIPPYTPNI
jgi:TctA family transporter